MHINTAKRRWFGALAAVAVLLSVTTSASTDVGNAATTTEAETQARPVLGHYRNHRGGGTWLDNMREAERIYHPFAGHWRSYHPAGMLPMDPETRLGQDEITAAGEGKRLHISWRPWPDGGSWATPHDDQTLDRVLTRLRDNCGPDCWLSIAHEPELDWIDNNAEGPVPGYTYADFDAMWAKVAAARTRVAADNVRLVWIVQGSPRWRDDHYHELWPGNDLVDVVGQDPYIGQGEPAATLGERMVNRIEWFRDRSNDNPDTNYAGKPHVIAEYGCDVGGGEGDRGTVTHRADCIDGVRAVLDDLADIDGITVAELAFFDARTNFIEDPPSADGEAYRNLKDATER